MKLDLRLEQGYKREHSFPSELHPQNKTQTRSSLTISTTRQCPIFQIVWNIHLEPFRSHNTAFQPSKPSGTFVCLQDASNMTDPTSSTSASAVDAAITPEEQLKFELFPKLPPELRLKIWNLVPEPRVVDVIFKRDHRKNNYKFLATFPAILHVSQEARTEGLRRYQQVSKTKWALNGVFFDFETDILCFSGTANESQKNLFSRKFKDLAKVRNFVVDGWTDFRQIGSFTGLKKLILLCPQQIGNNETLEEHECGVAEGDVGIHEMEHLMARYPDKERILKEALSYSQKWYASHLEYFCKFWQEPTGYAVVYAAKCDKAPQRPYSVF
jgi:hypothetical protein